MKEWMKPTRLEWTSYFTMMPVLACVLNNLLFPSKGLFDKEVLLYSFPVIMAIGFGSWYIHILVMHWLRIVYPDIQQTGKRLMILAASHILLTWGSFIAIFYSYDASHFLGYNLDWKNLQTSLFLGVALTLVA